MDPHIGEEKQNKKNTTILKSLCPETETLNGSFHSISFDFGLTLFKQTERGASCGQEVSPWVMTGQLGIKLHY